MRACFVVLVFSAIGCTSSTGDDPPGRAAPPTPPPPVVAKPAVPIDLSLGDGFQMLHPIRDGRLAVIPIVQTGGVTDDTSYLTLADGVARDLVTVRELGRGDSFVVDTVRIKNKSHQPLFVMSGEMIVEGLQDRVIAEDRVIPPGKSVRVSVRCVEMGREDGSLAFSSARALVEFAVREAVTFKTQTEVWAQVAEINTHLGLAPPSKTYRLAMHLQTAPVASERRDRLTAAIAGLQAHARIVGLAQVVDGEVVAIDRFATPELFAGLESELLGSYIASDDGAPHEGRTFLPRDVRALAASPDARRTAASFSVLLRGVSAGRAL